MTLDEIYNWLEDQRRRGGLALSGFDHGMVPDVGGYAGDDGNAVIFVVNGVGFCAREDPSDGYRSHMEEDVGLVPADLVRNRFERVPVLAVRDKSDSRDALELRDVVTGNIIVEIGTDSTDDYYPRFLGSFYPESMSVNVDVAAFSAPKRQPHYLDAPARGINLKGWQHGDGDGGEK